MIKRHILYIGIVLAACLLGACTELQDQIGSIKFTDSDRQALQRTGQALRSSFSDITEEEEYYIGRAVAAVILSRYPVYQNQELTEYVNQIGHAVAAYSSRPEIYAGYHFLVLDSDDVNALAAPGGFIFITKGLLQRCRNEEMLGCVLAHEVGHVAAKHGLKSIKKSRLIDAFKIIGQETARKYGSEELSELTAVFEDVLGDIAESLIERGYDRKYEYEADQLGAETGARTGYDPNGMIDFLQTMIDPEEDGKGWFDTHPAASDRIGRLEKAVSSLGSGGPGEENRGSRFNRMMRDLDWQ
jgi:beta-barrel assembly-enhancing protease